MSTVATILNTIRDNASDLYIARVPEATRDNLTQVGQAITSDKNIMNEYITSLVTKVAKTRVMSKLFKNPLAKLKGENIPFGATIEELYINPAVNEGYDPDGTTLLKTTKPDGKVCYYSIGEPRKYPVTVFKRMVVRSFRSESEYMELLNKIIVSLYSGDNIDEFLLMKNLLGKSIDEGVISVVETDIASPKDVAKAISSASGHFQFPTTVYAGYNQVNKASIAAGETPAITFCSPDDQVLIMPIDTQTEINYEYLASQFNIDVVKLKAMTIAVDNIPSEKYDIYALLCDKAAIRVHDVDYDIEEMNNGATKAVNYWLHHLQYMHLSMFANCQAFGKKRTS